MLWCDVLYPVGVGLLLALVQILHCTKPWTVCCRGGGGRGDETRESLGQDPVPGVHTVQPNTAVIKIRSYREPGTSTGNSHQLETIAEAGQLRRSSDQDMGGSLKNLRNASIMMNSSKLTLP